MPFGPTGYGDSPYQCLSSFAGNPLLISPEELIETGLVSKEEVYECMVDRSNPNHADKDYNKWKRNPKVQYDKVIASKTKLLEKAFANFEELKKNKLKELDAEYNKFCKAEAYWLDDFVLYYALKQTHDLKPWIEWPVEHANRLKNPLKVWAVSNKKKLDQTKFVQWIFFKQWQKLKDYANSNGILIIGDCPIFVAHDSSDVWAHREYFTVDENGKLIFQARPAGYFSETQLV